MRKDVPLVIIPTYNERENIGPLLDTILALPAPLDILAVDDNSPDGTGKIIDEYAEKNSRVKALHRAAKLGIGSAHKAALAWAYDEGYAVALTMDADFTHRPDYLLKLLAAPEAEDVVVTSRFIERDSLPGWNWLRKSLTHLGHFLTVNLLALPYDATGALRRYRLDRLPREIFTVTESDGYSFFFESLFRISRAGKKIGEIPIELPARTYGTSKMRIRDALESVRLLLVLFWRYRIWSEGPASFRPSPGADEWNRYWSNQPGWWPRFYAPAAHIYRVLLIRPAFRYRLRRTFPPAARLLHAGCGGGQSDIGICNNYSLVATDFSHAALESYGRTVTAREGMVQADVRRLPFGAETFDGIYNLGVMEHFPEDDVVRILGEFRRLLKRDGKILLFWPPELSFSVLLFKTLRAVSRILLRRPEVHLHPIEITRLRSRRHAEELLERGGFRLREYSFGPRDFFTQVALVAEKV